jgi:hypothetical protein
MQVTMNVVKDKRCFLLLQSSVSKRLRQDTREWIQTSLLRSIVRFVPKAVAGQLLIEVPRDDFAFVVVSTCVFLQFLALASFARFTAG